MSVGFVPARPEGSDARSRWMQWAHDAVLNRLKISGPGISETTKGFAVQQPPIGGAESPVRELMVKEVFDDYLRCHSYDTSSEVEGTTNIYVAKDTALRNSITEENKTGTDYTYTYAAGDDIYNMVRTSDDGATTEDQVVTPPWMPDEIIFAVKCRTGVYRTADDKPQEEILPADVVIPITLLYLSPNRQWAMQSV